MAEGPIPTQQDYPNSCRVDFLFKIISRYDNYILSTNAKASLIIAWNGVVIGAILLKSHEIINHFSSMPKTAAAVAIFLALCGIAALVSNALIFGVVFPFLTATIGGERSRIFFGSVAKTKPLEYLANIQAISTEELIEDLAQQVCTLAVGLDSKMHRLRKSIAAIYVELAIIALLVILLIFHK